jgi:hypothetical protein
VLFIVLCMPYIPPSVAKWQQHAAQVDAFDGDGDVNELAGAQRLMATDIDKPRFKKDLTIWWLRRLKGSLKAAGCKSADKVDVLKASLKQLLGAVNDEEADVGRGQHSPEYAGTRHCRQGSSSSGLHHAADSGQGLDTRHGDPAGAAEVRLQCVRVGDVAILALARGRVTAARAHTATWRPKGLAWLGSGTSRYHMMWMQ